MIVLILTIFVTLSSFAPERSPVHVLVVGVSPLHVSASLHDDFVGRRVEEARCCCATADTATHASSLSRHCYHSPLLLLYSPWDHPPWDHPPWDHGIIPPPHHLERPLSAYAALRRPGKRRWS